MTLEENIQNFLKIVETKTEEGINKLMYLCIGTKEYEMMTQHIINNINLLKNGGPLQERHQERPQERRDSAIKDIVGKEFL